MVVCVGVDVRVWVCVCVCVRCVCGWVPFLSSRSLLAGSRLRGVGFGFGSEESERSGWVVDVVVGGFGAGHDSARGKDREGRWLDVCGAASLSSPHALCWLAAG